MFEQLFGSKTRVKLMRVFLDNPEKKFFVRELTRLTDSLINSIRRELDNLIELKLIKVEISAKLSPEDEGKKKLNAKKYYYLNANNLFQRDLVNLFSKGKILVEKKLVSRIRSLGDVKLIILSGFFIDDIDSKTDLLVVGDFSIDRAKNLIETFEKEISQSIRYTFMTTQEFQLRQDIVDKFTVDVLNNPNNLVVLDKIGYKQAMEDEQMS